MRGASALAAFGAVLVAAGVALGAYAAHGLEGDAVARAQTASLHAMLHGIGLVALARIGTSRLGMAAMALVALGALLFCGTLAISALAGTPTVAAPYGGSALILGWLLAAIAILRAPRGA